LFGCGIPAGSLPTM